MAMELSPVESSLIAAIGWDPETEQLGVAFSQNRFGEHAVYVYDNFTEEEWDKLQRAESLGSYFTEHVKKQPHLFPYRKADPWVPPEGTPL